MRWLIIFTQVSCFLFLGLAGWSATKLNPPLWEGGKVINAKFLGETSPYVISLIELSSHDRAELFRISYEEGDVINLSGILPPQTTVSDFIISQDRKWVVFPLLDLNDFHDELYSVPLEGGPKVKLNGPLVEGGSVTGWWISPNSKYVVYTADQQVNDVIEVFSSRLGGGDNFRVNAPLALWGVAYAPKISADSQTVVYLSDQEQDQVFELFRAPIQGGASVKVSGVMAAPDSDVLPDFLLSSNGQYVVYRADQETQEKYEIFSTSLSGLSNVKLNAPLAVGGQVNGLILDPKGDRVVYWADQTLDNLDEIWSVPIQGGNPSRINGSLVSGGDAYLPTFSADGKFIVYYSDQEADGVFGLYRSRITGEENIKISPPLEGGEFVTFEFQVVSNEVFYRVWKKNQFQAYRSSIASGEWERLNEALPSSCHVKWIHPSQDAKTVVYIANTNVDSPNELFRSFSETNGIKLNNPLVKGGSFDKFAPILEINPEATHLIYGVDQEADEREELYVVPLVPPVITSPTSISLKAGELFHYKIQAKNGPILDYGVAQSPVGTVVQSNRVWWTPYQTGLFHFAVWATNDAGIGRATVVVEVKASLIPDKEETNKASVVERRAPYDVLFQKKKKVSGMNLTSQGVQVKTITSLNKRERVRGAGWLNTTEYGFIVQSNEWVKAFGIESNGNYLGFQFLIQLPDRKLKIRATGDANQDGLIDFLVGDRTGMGLMVSPHYQLEAWKQKPHSAKSVLGLINSGTNSNLIFKTRKRISLWSWSSTEPILTLSLRHPVKAMHQGNGFFQNRFIFTRKGKLSLHPIVFYEESTPLVRYRRFGKIVGPK